MSCNLKLDYFLDFLFADIAALEAGGLHRPWFHSEGSHGRVAPFASERRPFEVDLS